MSPSLLTTLALVVAVLVPLTVTAQGWEEPLEESFKLIASDGAEGDRFGSSLDISGDRLVVGAYADDLDDADDGEGEDSGAAYVYRLDADTQEWVEEQKLTASDADSDDLVGLSVSIDGDRIAVSAPLDGDEAPKAGSVYVFRYDSDSEEWVEEAKLVASDAEEDDRFGISVSLSGDWLAVSAPRDDDEGEEAGSAYLFRFDPDTDEWVEEQKLLASDAEESDRFGVSVSLSGEHLVVGAPVTDDGGLASGAAYWFRFDSDSDEWVEEQKITASDADEFARFGQPVRLEGEQLAVSATGADSSAGAVYVFRLDADSDEWVEEQKLAASDGDQGDRLGAAMSLSGDILVAGAGGHDVDGKKNIGAAYVFRYDADAAEWIEDEKLTASDTVAYSGFAISVAVSGSRVVVGSFNDSDNGDDAGAIYTYDSLCDPGVEFLRGDADNDGIVSEFGDALFLLKHRYQDGPAPACNDAADADDSGVVSGLVDALFLLRWRFLEGDEPPAPGPTRCGTDSCDDELNCRTASEECS